MFKDKILTIFLILLALIVNPISANAEKISIPLSKVVYVEPVTLKGISNSYSLKLPFPERWNITSAELELEIINSISLIENRSQLSIWFNNKPIGQVRLSNKLPEGKMKIKIPVNLIKPIYNELVFKVAQHSQEFCEDPAAEELWTTLFFDRAVLNIDYTQKEIPMLLSSIDEFLFDDKIFPSYAVNLVVENFNDENILSAMKTASAIALRLKYRPVQFQIGKEIKNDMDNVIIGTNQFTRKLLGERITADGISILSHPQGQKYAVVALSSDDRKKLNYLIESFSFIDFRFIKMPAIKVETISNYTSKKSPMTNFLQLGKVYLFKELGYKTRMLKGIYAGSVDLEFNMPSEAFLKPNDFLTILLNFSYGSGMRPSSMINISVNGKFIQPISLDNSKGGYIKDYVIKIPMTDFKKGYNKISFIPVLTPQSQDPCAFVQTENLLLTIFDDSKIVVPNVDRWVAMPDLKLLFANGFPFIKTTNNALVLLEKSESEISSALNLIGALTQKAESPFVNINIISNPDKIDGNALIIGNFEKLPEKIKSKVPFKNSEGYVLSNALTDTKRKLKSWEYRAIQLFSKILPVDFSEEFLRYDIQGEREIANFSGFMDKNWALLTEIESPWKNGKTILILTSYDHETLKKSSYLLINPSVQALVDGNTVLLNPEADIESEKFKFIISAKHGDRYYIGRLGMINSLSYFVYKHPYITIVTLLITFILFSFLLFKLLKGIMKLRLKKHES
ncbi:cellulose biosynthesis cyclic di-GMP-binding regulatory protein BcsB [Thermodesulfovibrio hydrogeniphilus]